jgi:EAL domain-containing protein (putative c-di-GMP-specific phosphodiesterase class I)
MRALKAMGLSLSIDDFGTGYSSLSALKSFPISTLKIDKSFISDLADNLDDQAIAMAVISLAHKLNLRVIAEGVETEQQRAFLRRHDCDEMQGYLYSPPVPAARISSLLAGQAGARVAQALALNA